MENYLYLLAFWSIVSIIGAIATAYDKHCAINNKWRISERTLLLLALLGGALLILATMLTLRHKTRKPKFMLTLPLLIALHIALLIFVYIRF